MGCNQGKFRRWGSLFWPLFPLFQGPHLDARLRCTVQEKGIREALMPLLFSRRLRVFVPLFASCRLDATVNTTAYCRYSHGIIALAHAATPLNEAAIGSDLPETSFALRLQLGAKRPQRPPKRTGSRARAHQGSNSAGEPPGPETWPVAGLNFPVLLERKQNTRRLLCWWRLFSFFSFLESEPLFRLT